ncbi:hypothetical protein [Streptomyces erythrochromogenes]|uniref:hypothetical protein n=1 Tax=Streptomyces erythrochromogenes TaxID=285574 RepID=UPI00386B8753|nr:hypothetical protein OG489_21410 [Streptomyces erythrochromogenes]
MRLTKTLTAVTAAVALTALTGCGGEADGGPLAAFGLPKADDMAALEKLLNKNGPTCRELEPRTASDLEERLKDLSAFAVKETATCKAGRDEFTSLMLLSDMKKFQEANKKALEADPDFDTSYFVGQNFAVAAGNDDAARRMKAAGLALMVCDPKFKAEIPSGYKISEELVKGCFVTDYLPS